MVITSLPGMTLMASSTNRISRTISTENNTLWLQHGMTAPSGDFQSPHVFTGRDIERAQAGAYLLVEMNHNLAAGSQFTVDLDGAAWYFRQSASGFVPGAAAVDSWVEGAAGIATVDVSGLAIPFSFVVSVDDTNITTSLPANSPITGHGIDFSQVLIDATPTNLNTILTSPPFVATPPSGVPGTVPATETTAPLGLAQTALGTAVAQWLATPAGAAFTNSPVWTTELNATAEFVTFTAQIPAGILTDLTVPTRVFNAVAGTPGAGSFAHPAFYGPGTPIGLNWSTIRPNFGDGTHTFDFLAATGTPGSTVPTPAGPATDGRYVTFNSATQMTTFWNLTPASYGTVPFRLDIAGGVFQNRATITLLADAVPAAGGATGDVIAIPLVMRTTRDDDIRVRIAAGFHQIANTTHVIGTHADGRVNVAFEAVTMRHHQVDIGRMRLTEQRVGSIPNTRWEFELTAPSGYEWSLDNMTGANGHVLIDATLAWEDGATGQTGQRPLTIHPSNVTNTTLENDDNVSVRFRENRNTEDRSRMIVHVPAGLIQPSSAGNGGSMIFFGLRLLPDDYTAVVEGRDLYANVRNTRNTVLPNTNVRIGTARDFGITLTRVAGGGMTTDVPYLISGRLEQNIGVNGGTWSGNAEDRYHRAANVRFQETIQDSWWAMRNTVFTVPEGVRFLQVEFYDSRQLPMTQAANRQLHEGTNLASANPLNPHPFYNIGRRAGSVTVNHNTLTLHGLSVNPNATARFDMRIWLNIQVDFDGDIYLTLANSAFRQVDDNYDAEVLIARAVTPIAVETEVTEARVGFQFVTVADFSIIENVAGALLHGEYVYVTITDEIAVDMAIAPGFTQSVTDGNIRISNVRTNTILGWSGVSGDRGQLQFTVERASTVPSTIEFSNVQVRIDRTVPFSNLSLVDTQGYDIHVWGPAVARNFRGLYGSTNAYPFVTTATQGAARNERDLFPVGSISEQYVLIETPGEFAQGGDFGRYVRVPVPSTVVTVDGVERTLPVATWICPTSSSAMVPIRFVSYALGLEEGAVRWDPATSTVTVDAGVRIVQFQTGNSFYVVNGVPIRMTNVAGEPVEMQIRYERSFVPFRALGEAFNIPVYWEAATATAVYNPR